MTTYTLKLFYDEDIATLTHNGTEFKSGTEYNFDNTVSSKLFKYQLKNGTLPSGAGYTFWATNTYFQTGAFDSGVFNFSDSDVTTAYNNLYSNSAIEKFLCITSARYNTPNGLNKVRPLIICGDYVTKKVQNNGSTDTITVTFDPSYQLTNVNVYYRNSSGGKYEPQNSGISADKHTFTTSVPHIDIADSFATTNDYSYIVVPTLLKNAEPTLNSADITLQYNDGVTSQTLSYQNQTAGTITGTVKSNSDYSITGITGAYYQDRYGNKTTLSTLTTTKQTDQQYNFSLVLSDTDINFFKTNTTSKLYLTVTTVYSAGTTLNLTYNDGVTTQTITYPNQKAGTVTGTVKSATGYRITKVTRAGYHDRYTAKDFSNFLATKVSDTEFNFSFDVSSDDLRYIKASTDVVVDITVITENTAVSANIPVQYNDGVTTQTLNYTNVKAGQTITGTVNSASGYTITSVKGAYYAADKYGNKVNVTNFIATKVSNYKYNFSFEITDTDIQRFAANLNYYVIIDLTTAKELGSIGIDTSKLSNCSVSPSTVVQSTATEITLSADLGYILDGTGTYTVDDVATSFTCTKQSSYRFTVTANKTISVTFTATKVESKPASILHSYILDETGYNLLGKQYVEGVNANGDGFTQYDYSKFINYIFEIPFAVPESMTKPTQTISLGKVSLNVPCSYITDDTLTVDLGTLSLPIKDSTDYKVNYISLFVPFCETIELPTSVLGSTLSISMQINLLNESATVIVLQDNTVIVTHETEIFTDLPLYFSAGTKDTLVKTFKTQYQNTIKQAYVNIAYNKPVTDLISYSTNEHGTLGNYKGFTRVTRGTIKNSINQEIDGIIIDTLTQGVIIK